MGDGLSEGEKKRAGYSLSEEKERSQREKLLTLVFKQAACSYNRVRQGNLGRCLDCSIYFL